jgi:putative transposase
VVFDKAVAVHGVPQRLLSDNGVALNPSRRGVRGQLVEHVSGLGVEAITGKPYKPTTQGKNERFHQTLFRYLDKQPLAGSLADLQAQVNAFDHIYNTERPHQGLPGRVTPQAAWEATVKAEPPRPQPDPPLLVPVVARALRPLLALEDLPAAARVRRLTGAGTFMLAGVQYKVDGRYGFEDVVVVIDGDTITVTDLHGEILIEHTRPAPGVTYVGNGRRPGGRSRNSGTSPMS